MSAKKCVLCERGVPTYRRGKVHGFSESGAMLDVACPIDQVELDEIIGLVTGLTRPKPHCG